MHIIGASGSGKSRFLAHLYLSLLRQGRPATLIDPHGQLARLVLTHLVADGRYRDPTTFQRIAYLDLPAAERAGRFLPLNVLAQHGAPSTVASNILDAMHRTWPALGEGAAPRFDKLVQYGVKVLISNRLPLPALVGLLTNPDFRTACLGHEPDPDVVAFFRDQYDRLAERDRLDYADSTLSRLSLLTFAPILKYSLGQQQLGIDFRRLMDERRSLIVNLAIENGAARPLLGSLLTVMAEQGAISRAELPATEPLSAHHLLLDEAFEHTAQTETALAKMLSQTRKFGLFVVMAHQTWSQASTRLRGALQNVGIRAVFNLDHEDAVTTAGIIGSLDLGAIKHEADDAQARATGHPVFESVPEQWARWAQAIEQLDTAGRNRPGELFVKQRGQAARKVRSPFVPTPAVAPETMAMVEQRYVATYFQPQHAIDQHLAARRDAPEPEPRTRRVTVVQRT